MQRNEHRRTQSMASVTDRAMNCRCNLPDSQLPMQRFLLSVVMCLVSGCATTQATDSTNELAAGKTRMRLGNFSVSLAVKDLSVSRAFYEKLGFRAIAGNAANNWLILQNETSTIGLFQGMFDKNCLTFNPGWDRACNTLPEFDDVRDIQRTLKSRGLALMSAADESTSGPASLSLQDPDGNPVLIDQHVQRHRQ